MAFSDGISRQIDWGGKDDTQEQRTISGLCKRKDASYLEILAQEGMPAYPDALELARALKTSLKIGVGSAATRCTEMLKATGIEDILEIFKPFGLMLSDRI